MRQILKQIVLPEHAGNLPLLLDNMLSTNTRLQLRYANQYPVGYWKIIFSRSK